MPTYYLDFNRGNDAADGLSPGGPKRTFEAVRGLLAHGDTVRCRRGTTATEVINPGAVNDLTIEGYGPQADGYWQVDGSSRTHCVQLANSHGGVVRDAELYGAQFGIGVSHTGAAGGWQIRECLVRDCTNQLITADSGQGLTLRRLRLRPTGTAGIGIGKNFTGAVLVEDVVGVLNGGELVLVTATAVDLTMRRCSADTAGSGGSGALTTPASSGRTVLLEDCYFEERGASTDILVSLIADGGTATVRRCTFKGGQEHVRATHFEATAQWALTLEMEACRHLGGQKALALVYGTASGTGAAAISMAHHTVRDMTTVVRIEGFAPSFSALNNIYQCTGAYYDDVPGNASFMSEACLYADEHTGMFRRGASTYDTLAAWQGATGQDGASFVADPRLTAEGELRSLSPAVAAAPFVSDIVLDNRHRRLRRYVSGLRDLGALRAERGAYPTGCIESGLASAVEPPPPVQVPLMAASLGISGELDIHPIPGTALDVVSDAREVLDCDMIYRTSAENQTAHQGARSVTQTMRTGLAISATNVTYSEHGLSLWGNGPGDYCQVDHAAATPQVSFYVATYGADAGTSYTISFYARLSPGWNNPEVTDAISWNFGGFDAGINVPLTSEWQRFSTEPRVQNGSKSTMIQIYASSGVAADEAWSIQTKGWQVERNTGGASVPCCAEYVQPTDAIRTVYLGNCNGNSRNVTTHVVTEAPGPPLHPSSTRDSAPIYDHYRTWAASTPYAAGARRIPDVHVEGPAGGNGYWYECTTPGTSGATAPAWNTTVGGTTSDGIAVWTNRGLYSLAGLVCEPTRTNLVLHNEDISNAAWSKLGGLTVQLASGVDSLGTDKAWTLTDPSVTNASELRGAATVPNDDSWVTASVFVRRAEAPVSVFPLFIFSISFGTFVTIEVRLDPYSGATHIPTASDPSDCRVDAIGNGWWRLSVMLKNNASGSTFGQWRIWPAYASTLEGSVVPSLTGALDISHPQIEIGKFASSPKRTADQAITAAAAQHSLSVNAALLDPVGAAAADVYMVNTWDKIADVNHNAHVVGSAGRPIAVGATVGGQLYVYDGTASASGDAGASYPDRVARRAGTAWGVNQSGSPPNGNLAASVEGQPVGTPYAYDGTMFATTLTLGYSAQVPLLGTIRNFALYDAELPDLPALSTPDGPS